MTGRDPDEEHRASTPLELLFDLTFVIAVARAASQLKLALDQGHAGHALVAYSIVFFGLWWAWVNFTPVAVCTVMLGLLTTRTRSERTDLWLVLLTAALVLVTASAAAVLTLPVSIVIMAGLAVVLLVYHLAMAHQTAAHQAAGCPCPRATSGPSTLGYAGQSYRASRARRGRPRGRCSGRRRTWPAPRCRRWTPG